MLVDDVISDVCMAPQRSAPHLQHGELEDGQFAELADDVFTVNDPALLETI